MIIKTEDHQLFNFTMVESVYKLRKGTGFSVMIQFPETMREGCLARNVPETYADEIIDYVFEAVKNHETVLDLSEVT